MNKSKLLIGGLLAMALVLVVITLRSQKPAVSPPEVTVEPARESRGGVAKPALASPGRTQDLAVAKTGLHAVKVAKKASAPGSRVARVAASASVTGTMTPREQAVAVWEQQIDDVIAHPEVPVEQHAERVKEAFHKLDKADQLEGMQRGLNLLPDDQFPVLYDVLFDKKEDPEVLDAIFSDALNRPEDIKNPIMKELRKDREHPMFFESARILDVVEPEEEKDPMNLNPAVK